MAVSVDIHPNAWTWSKSLDSSWPYSRGWPRLDAMLHSKLCALHSWRNISYTKASESHIFTVTSMFISVVDSTQKWNCFVWGSNREPTHVVQKCVVFRSHHSFAYEWAIENCIDKYVLFIDDFVFWTVKKPNGGCSQNDTLLEFATQVESKTLLFLTCVSSWRFCNALYPRG